jgi:cytoskeletal protein RodZ
MGSAGSIIKKERVKRGISYEHISSITKISVDTLKCIEEGDISSMPSTYVKGFLRAIAKVLELDAEEILRIQFEPSHTEDNARPVAEKPIEKVVELKPAAKAEVKKPKPVEQPVDSKTEPQKSITSVFDKKQTLASIKGKSSFSMPNISISPGKAIAAIVPVVIIVVGFVVYNNNGFIDDLFVGLETSPDKGTVAKKALDPVSVDETAEIAVAKDATVESKDVKKDELAKIAQKTTLDKSKGFSVLTIFASGRSWVKLQIDDQNVQTMTFIAGMTRSFKIYDLAKLFIGDISQVDVYYENKKMRFGKGSKEKIIKLKHTLLAKKMAPKPIKFKKRAAKVDRELISKPKLNAEELTR